MDLTEIVAWRASESLVFGDLLCTDNAGRKKRNFNCRWGTKIVDISQGGSVRAFTRDDETFTAYKPHGKKRGDKYVHLADRKKAIRALIRLGLLEEDP